MTTTTCTFAAEPISPDVADELRSRDDAGRRPEVVVEQEGGTPLRCCLRRSRPGDRLALLSYAPLRRWARERGVDPGPYDETGPVFIHAQPCPGYSGEAYPPELRGLPRMLRGYDARGRILRGLRTEGGDDAETAVARLLDDPHVAVVHVRAIEFGCFTFAVRRVE